MRKRREAQTGRALMPLTVVMTLVAVLMVPSAVFAFPAGKEANPEPR